MAAVAETRMSHIVARVSYGGSGKPVAPGS